MDNDAEETRDFWNRAEDWRIQVGVDGDTNRRLNSDPVLWAFAGDVRGLKVLDAGCGTGYLSTKLAEQGAQVTGVDFSEGMIGIARATDPSVDFRLDSCSELCTLRDDDFDLVVSNYVLMDTPDLRRTMKAFYRVLKPGGAAVLVFSHPCFPAGCNTVSEGGDEVTYAWDFPYFRRQRRTDPPWPTSHRSSFGFTGPCRTTGKRSLKRGSMWWISKNRGSRRTGFILPRRKDRERRARPVPIRWRSS